MKSKKEEKSKRLLGIRILLCYEFMARNKRWKRYADFGVLFLAIVLQRFNTCIINYLGIERCNHLKDQSLMLGMASCLGLSTIVMFGFNFGKSVQEFWRDIKRKEGLNRNEELLTSGIQINYWQLILLILLYVCIVIDCCTLYYILLAYDILCYVLLILKLWLIANVGEQYLNYIFYHDMQGELCQILGNCVDYNGTIDIGVVRTYIKRLSEYLNLEKDGGGIHGFQAEALYKESKNVFNNSMEKLVLDRDTQSFLLLAIMRNFCKEMEKFDKFKAQILLGVMITYALDWEKNINVELLYREITNWNDTSLGLRYCIAVARMEYLHTVHKESNSILLSENIFYLYRRPIVLKTTYRDIICVLWYLWCCEDEKNFMLYTEDMWQIIRLCQENVTLYHLSEAGESLYKLIKGLKY